MSKNILIFGGSGFIGTHYSKKLLSEGFTVYIIDIKSPRFIDDNLIYIKRDVRDLADFNLDFPIMLIYNFAAVHTTPGHPAHEYYETNIGGANSICDFAERHKVTEIVFTSSISVYGPDEEEKDESSKLTPNSSYGFSKMLAEKIHHSWLLRNLSNKLIVVRPAVVFGPGEGGNFTRLAAVMRKGFFVYPGRKDTVKSCIYVDDLIGAIEKSRSMDSKYELLNGAYPEMYTLEDIVECFKKNHFPKVKLLIIPKSLVLVAAKVFRVFDFLNIGIHPERVMKLIISTNIYPRWIESNVEMNEDLASALQRWSDETDGRFD